MRTRLIAGALVFLLGGCGFRAVNATVTDLHLPTGADLNAVSLGQDGRLWFSYLEAQAGPGIGTIGGGGDAVSYSLAPQAFGFAVNDIAVRSDGSAWLVLACDPPQVRCSNAGYGRMTPPAISTLRMYRIDDGVALPNGIALDADGSAWISDQRGAVVRVLASGRQHVVALHDARFAPDLIVAAKDAIYLAGAESGKVCRIDRREHIRWIATPDKDAHVITLAAGKDGGVWATEFEANKILFIGADGTIRSFTVPTADAKPYAITVDARGAAWFTELSANKLGRVDPDGSIRDAPLPIAISTPVFAFAAPDGTLYVVGTQSHWFGLYRTFVVARIPQAGAFP